VKHASPHSPTERVRSTADGLGQYCSAVEAWITGHLERVVRGAVEETLNALLDAKADRFCGGRAQDQFASLSIMWLNRVMF
jgi:hypothetical protein